MSRSGPQQRSLITRIFSRSRDQSNSNNEESFEQEIRRITEEKKAVEAQLQLTQDKLHREQERARGLEMYYRRQVVELREAGAAKEELESDRRRLEEQLRRKDEELRIQEEEQAKLKRDYQHQGMRLRETQESLASREEKAKDEILDMKRRWAQLEGEFNLERRAYENKLRNMTAKCEEMNHKYAVLNQENDELNRKVKLLSKQQQQPPVVVHPVNPNGVRQSQHVPKTHECWKLSAIELLRQCDDLLGNMASNLKPSPIKCSTSDWKHLCEQLEVNSESLFHVDSNERLINIIQQHQQQTDGPVMTIRCLYKTLKSINANRAASLLLEKAYDVCKQRKRSASESQMHTGAGGSASMPHAKTSSSFPYACKQNFFVSDSMSESDAEGDSLAPFPVTVTSSVNTTLYTENESVEFSDTETPHQV